MRTILASIFEMAQRKSQMFVLDVEARISSDSRPLFPDMRRSDFLLEPAPKDG